MTISVADELAAAGVDRHGLSLPAARLAQDAVARLILAVPVGVACAVAGVLAVGVRVVLGLAVVVVPVRLVGAIGILPVARTLGDLALDIV